MYDGLRGVVFFFWGAAVCDFSREPGSLKRVKPNLVIICLCLLYLCGFSLSYDFISIVLLSYNLLYGSIVTWYWIDTLIVKHLIGKTLYPILEYKQKIWRWLHSEGLRDVVLVRVDTRNSLRADPFESVVTRHVVAASFNVFIRVHDSKNLHRTFTLFPTRKDGRVV